MNAAQMPWLDIQRVDTPDSVVSIPGHGARTQPAISLYENLQILSTTLFERTPLDQLRMHAATDLDAPRHVSR